MRSYLLAKRKFLRENTPHDHIMIVPGSRTEQVEGGGARYGLCGVRS